uniref:Putative secreted protein n=1 Tax=Anopheles darlingi TaxID=43151 RepID=A0A2M4DJ25_ANODA
MRAVVDERLLAPLLWFCCCCARFRSLSRLRRKRSRLIGTPPVLPTPPKSESAVEQYEPPYSAPLPTPSGIGTSRSTLLI